MFLNRLHLNSLLTNPEIFVSVNEEDIVEISRTTGIMVDPVYNVKAIRGMLHEMNTNPERFKSHRILYIHTGEYNLSTSSVINTSFPMAKSMHTLKIMVSQR